MLICLDIALSGACVYGFPKRCHSSECVWLALILRPDNLIKTTVIISRDIQIDKENIASFLEDSETAIHISPSNNLTVFVISLNFCMVRFLWKKPSNQLSFGWERNILGRKQAPVVIRMWKIPVPLKLPEVMNVCRSSLVRTYSLGSVRLNHSWCGLPVQVFERKAGKIHIFKWPCDLIKFLGNLNPWENWLRRR